LFGEKGVIMHGTYGGGVRIIPEEKMQAYDRPERPPRTPGHHEGWVLACKSGEPAVSDFSYAGPLTEMVLLGDVALRAGQPIEWNAKEMKVANLPEADKFVRREYRDGWSL